MKNGSERRVAELVNEVQRLRQQLQQRPRVLSIGASAQVLHLRMVDGQTVYSDAFQTLYGSLFTSSTLTTVPAIYDPNAASGTPGAFTAATGIFRAVLYINDVQQSGFVLGLNDGRAGNLVRMAIYNGEQCEALPAISLPLVSDSTQSSQLYPVKFM